MRKLENLSGYTMGQQEWRIVERKPVEVINYKQVPDIGFDGLPYFRVEKEVKTEMKEFVSDVFVF